MLAWAIVIWVLGLVTLVPYGTWYLLFEAPRDQYAILIVGVLFWVFGYWGLVGPLLAGLKVRRVFRTLEQAGAQGRLLRELQGGETRDAAIEMIARENGIPKFLARRVYALLVRNLERAPTR